MPPDSVGMLPAGPPPPVLEVAVAVGGTPVAVAVGIPAGVFVTVGVSEGVNVGPPGVIDAVRVGVEVGVGVRVGVDVFVGVSEGVSVGPPGVIVEVGGGGVVGVGVGVGVEVGVEVGTPAGVFVAVGVGVTVEVGVIVAVDVGVGVFVGVKVGPPGVMVGVAVTMPVTAKHCENSDVLLFGSVAVAVMTDPAVTPAASVTLKLPWQKASVETVVLPRNV